jgi:hypothetical protein
MEFEIDLKGESEALKVKINSYKIFEKDGKNFIKIDGLETSREWINIFASNYLNGREFEIPKDIVILLSMLK